MKLCTIEHEKTRQAAILNDETVIPIKTVNHQLGTAFPPTCEELITQCLIRQLSDSISGADTSGWDGIPIDQAVYRAPYLNPPKIWGIGLNFPKHAGDLQARLPTDEPASFMKPLTTIIGPEETILLPPQSERVTGEAEIGVIIGKECKDVEIEDVEDVILGYTTIIDMTAEDILQKNPRFLTRCKSFDTFFSFGPFIVTADEIEDVTELTITTWINGKEHRSAQVKQMTFPPFELVSFHSKVMTLKPGDIISCGTPGAHPLKPGDRVGCTVTDIGKLENPVDIL